MEYLLVDVCQSSMMIVKLTRKSTLSGQVAVTVPHSPMMSNSIIYEEFIMN